MRVLIALIAAVGLPTTAWAQDVGAPIPGVFQVDAEAQRSAILADQVVCHDQAMAAKRMDDFSVMVPSNPVAMVVTLAAVATTASLLEQRRSHDRIQSCMADKGYRPITPAADDEARFRAAQAQDAHVQPFAVIVSFAPEPTRFTQGVMAGDGVSRTYIVGRY